MKMVGSRDYYVTYNEQPMPDGKYHIGEGGRWGWKLGRGYKTAEAAKKAAIKLAGTDKFEG